MLFLFPINVLIGQFGQGGLQNEGGVGQPWILEEASYAYHPLLRNGAMSPHGVFVTMAFASILGVIEMDEMNVGQADMGFKEVKERGHMAAAQSISGGPTMGGVETDAELGLKMWLEGKQHRSQHFDGRAWRYSGSSTTTSHFIGPVIVTESVACVIPLAMTVEPLGVGEAEGVQVIDACTVAVAPSPLPSNVASIEPSPVQSART